jgi:hypothetical protein
MDFSELPEETKMDLIQYISRMSLCPKCNTITVKVRENSNCRRCRSKALIKTRAIAKIGDSEINSSPKFKSNYNRARQTVLFEDFKKHMINLLYGREEKKLKGI